MTMQVKMGEEYGDNPPVVIKSNNRQIIVNDSLSPEANAMALAMYSRSPKSYLLHLLEVLKKGAAKFMSTFYVGYGHKSIGDCGSTTICAEHVSMLVAKAIQDNELYNGQEASTRYMDMANEEVLNPAGTELGAEIQTQSMRLYNKALAELVPYLTEKYPALPDDDPKLYEKAIKAKAFDIARSFIPAGCTTYVGWHSTLRQAWDHVKEMTFHPLAETRETANMMLEALREKYPNSFNFKTYEEQDRYMQQVGDHTYEDNNFSPLAWLRFRSTLDLFNISSVEMGFLKMRPKKTELPDKFKRYGQIRFRFKLDFGSFRDIQRHRSCTQAMPLLTTRHGFHPWYLTSLPPTFRTHVEKELEDIERKIGELTIDPIIRQYYIPMGYMVVCDLTAGLPSAIYIAELRSDQTVHPTLRLIAQEMGRILQSLVPDMALHCDMNPDQWSVARGKHDIVKKAE
jgi:thymidylate synthase ThyX